MELQKHIESILKNKLDLNKHNAILISNLHDKKLILTLIKSIITEKKEENKTLIFSDQTIESFIAKEYQYDATIFSERKLRSFSSGERRKLFFQYCINQNPQYIILENGLDHLDIQAKANFLASLNKHSKTIKFIQIATRKNDILPFATNIIELPVHDHKKLNANHDVRQLSKLLENDKKGFETIIEFKNVSVNYQDKKVVKNINWKINSCESWQLIGPNGSGKSTLLSLIIGDNPKGYGQDLFIFGKKKGSGESVWEIKQKIGYYNQSLLELFRRNYSLKEMILSGYYDSIGLYKIPTSLQIKTVEKWADMIGIKNLIEKPFFRLSDGMQRIGLILRALIKQPKLLILDEPLVGLDDEHTELIIKLINIIFESKKFTTIFVSHQNDNRILPTLIYELSPSNSGSTGRIKSTP